MLYPIVEISTQTVQKYFPGKMVVEISGRNMNENAMTVFYPMDRSPVIGRAAPPGS
jgi:hypothetical protein